MMLPHLITHSNSSLTTKTHLHHSQLSKMHPHDIAYILYAVTKSIHPKLTMAMADMASNGKDQGMYV